MNNEKTEIYTFGRIPVDLIEKHEEILLLVGKYTYLVPFPIIFPSEVSPERGHNHDLPRDCNWQYV
jgi:hypothetical protein